MQKLTKGLLWGQGILYLLTGAWPLIHLSSFLAITGPKNEVWLVNTVGVLVSAIGASFIRSVVSNRQESSLYLLGFLCAIGLATIDIRYVSTGVIRNVYLLDAGIEGVIIMLWLIVFLRGRQK